jgi:tetratricopeptide (TPR) repeat protein
MKLALQEFRTAFTLDPQNLFARNGYSYAVWKWYLRGGPSSLTDMPTDAVYDAERHARDAARLGVGAADRSDAAAMRSTLGEVLMMQGRWHEAYRELEEAVKLAPKHSFFDEIRWELGLAYLCTGTIDRRPGRSTKAELDFEAAATRWFATIRTSDQGREIPSLTGDQPLEWHTAAAMCASDAGRNWSGDELEAMPYELQRSVPRTDAYAPCNQLAVTALVSSATVEEAEGIHLRVIGPELGAGGRRVARR